MSDQALTFEQALEALPAKRRLFVMAYLDCLNASEAARRADYSQPMQQGSRLLRNVDIAAAVRAGLSEKAMPREEVLGRLAEHARGDIGEFLELARDGGGFWIKLEGKPTRLIKKLRITKTTRNDNDDQLVDTKIELELYDAQAALTTLAKHHGLLLDRHEISGPNGAPLVNTDALQRAAEELAAWRQQQTGAILNGPSAAPIVPTLPTATDS